MILGVPRRPGLSLVVGTIDRGEKRDGEAGPRGVSKEPNLPRNAGLLTAPFGSLFFGFSDTLSPDSGLAGPPRESDPPPTTRPLDLTLGDPSLESKVPVQPRAVDARVELSSKAAEVASCPTYLDGVPALQVSPHLPRRRSESQAEHRTTEFVGDPGGGLLEEGPDAMTRSSPRYRGCSDLPEEGPRGLELDGD